MTPHPSGTLLQATRVIIIICLVLLGIAAVVLVIGGIVLPIKWDYAVSVIARERPEVDTVGLLSQILMIFAFGFVPIVLAWSILRKLLEIIATVEQGNPFVHTNAIRLKAVGWMMVASYVISVPLAIVAKEVAERFGDGNIDADGFSLTGVLAILLTFVLAGVFEQGAAMREEMEGTV